MNTNGQNGNGHVTERHGAKQNGCNGNGNGNGNGNSNGTHDHASNGNGSCNGKSNGNGVGCSQSVTTSHVADFMHFTALPLALIVSMTAFVLLLLGTLRMHDGSFVSVVKAGVWPCVLEAFAEAHLSSTAALLVGGYLLFALLVMLAMPGEQYDGPTTPRGNVPRYYHNGFRCYVFTMLAFAGVTLALKRQGLSPTIVYDVFFDVVLMLNVAAHVICTLLYIKGRFAPSSSDAGSSGNVVFDYYWGTELHPRVGPVDIKVFTNCRFGMTVWALLVCIFALKAVELHGHLPTNVAVSTLLQLAYITKFFWWEDGYMRTIDIMVDRAGFYICWGCLTFVPTFYTSTSHYLVTHPIDYSWPYAGSVLLIGLASIWLNYACDAQRQAFRAANGEYKIWGRAPRVIRATYRTEDGKQRENLLLASGYWGLARHFNYVFELALAFCWSLVGGFSCVFPFSYVIFLTILLVHRSVRDDRRCRERYGDRWTDYCRLVKYRIVPFVF